jgi:hypothetical protein
LKFRHGNGKSGLTVIGLVCENERTGSRLGETRPIAGYSQGRIDQKIVLSGPFGSAVLASLIRMELALQTHLVMVRTATSRADFLSV